MPKLSHLHSPPTGSIPAILVPLLKSYELPRHIETLRAYWDAEQARRAEFRAWVKDDKKHEFVNGEIVSASPSSMAHCRVVTSLAAILGTLSRRFAPDSVVLLEKAMIGCARNDYEPDVMWFAPAKAAGIGQETEILPPPDFDIEVLSQSTEPRDRGVKFEDYALNGIAEYWIIDADLQSVERYRLDAGCRAYGPAETGPDIAWRPTPDASSPAFLFPASALFDEIAFIQVLTGITSMPAGLKNPHA